MVITLLKLARPTNLHSIGHLFSVGKATAGEATLEVANVVVVLCCSSYPSSETRVISSSVGYCLTGALDRMSAMMSSFPGISWMVEEILIQQCARGHRGLIRMLRKYAKGWRTWDMRMMFYCSPGCKTFIRLFQMVQPINGVSPRRTTTLQNPLWVDVINCHHGTTHPSQIL
ncbi:hypothetical protein Y1Q_0011273 [Alligator mississippiensis]|uniref:Uncharacterized protein n=1 Tax=Alligator mississippiensis TaxID=8496 RepID=A0A151N8N0_ALLMI|nr:hypothetical protein Y1Q_0011273 [Alligator mississippiensis]